VDFNLLVFKNFIYKKQKFGCAIVAYTNIFDVCLTILNRFCIWNIQGMNLYFLPRPINFDNQPRSEANSKENVLRDANGHNGKILMFKFVCSLQ